MTLSLVYLEMEHNALYQPFDYFIVDKAAYEFAETETMLQKAEELCGPYVWGIYDILVLPPSFPYGGMENPCLTFATPTLLVRTYYLEITWGIRFDIQKASYA